MKSSPPVGRELAGLLGGQPVPTRARGRLFSGPGQGQPAAPQASPRVPLRLCSEHLRGSRCCVRLAAVPEQPGLDPLGTALRSHPGQALWQ